MKQVNVIRHLAFEDLGSFARVFEQQHYGVNYLEAGVDDLTRLEADSDDLLIVLGGPISANDEADFPFLSDEIALLAQRVRLDKPTLGICLGAQLIARAMGCDVYAGHQKEIGWAPIELSPQGEDSALSAIMQNNNMVLHWHGETFDLPTDARLLASTQHAENQAFQLGDRVIGLQFHLEATRAGMERWFIGHIGEIEQTEGISVPQLRQQTRQQAGSAERSAQAFLEAYLQQISA